MRVDKNNIDVASPSREALFIVIVSLRGAVPQATTPHLMFGAGEQSPRHFTKPAGPEIALSLKIAPGNDTNVSDTG
jgi:hypothetical protein